MIVFLKLTIAGTDTGPFDILTNSDYFTTPVQTDVTWDTLHIGYDCDVIPNDATIIRARSMGVCTNYDDANIGGITPGYYLHIGTTDDYISKTIACSQDVNKSYYTQNGNISVGVTVYLDLSLTTPITGDPARWMKIGENCVINSCDTYYACLINELGVIEYVELCLGIQGNAHFGDPIGYVGLFDCCNQSNPIEYFYSTDGTFDFGDIVYVDEDCLIPYVGDGHDYHKIEYQTGLGIYHAMRINSNGEILESIECN